MKKLIVLFAFVCLNTMNLYAYPVLLRETSGGLFGLYWFTRDEIGRNTENQVGRFITCKGPGLTRCPGAAPVTPNGDHNETLEAIDEQTMYLILSKIDPVIDKSNPGEKGRGTEKVQVEGEPFTRIYSYTWHINDDGSTYTRIDREENIAH